MDPVPDSNNHHTNTADRGEIVDGWLCAGARHSPSPNYNERPEGASISLLVVHNISLPPGQFQTGYIEQFFLNCLPVAKHPYFASIAGLRVSAHCLIERDGSVVQFVPFHLRAWHAGQSEFDGCGDCNNYSVGIELEGTDQLPYTDQQYQALILLSKKLMRSYPGIRVDRIVGHSDIAPTRKTDPGVAFDWSRYLSALEIQL